MLQLFNNVHCFTCSEKMCDGLFHCIYGEDESLETCRKFYPEEATIECIENRLDGINLTIMATPCNGIRECRNGIDEQCEISVVYFWSIFGGFFLLTVTVILIMKCLTPETKKNATRNEVEHTKYDSKDCSLLEGNHLAEMKVIFKSKYLFLWKWLTQLTLIPIRTKQINSFVQSCLAKRKVLPRFSKPWNVWRGMFLN